MMALVVLASEHTMMHKVQSLNCCRLRALTMSELLPNTPLPLISRMGPTLLAEALALPEL
eukprot:4315844-Prorocentrum_lima.AAC.1